MKKLQNYIFEKEVKKHLLLQEKTQKWVDFQNISTILLLFESDYTEKNPFIKDVITTLNENGKKVTAWGYVQKDKSTKPNLPQFKILGKKCVDWLKRPKENYLQELFENNYDLLIDLTIDPIIPLQYIGLYSNALLKTGLNRPSNHFYDFKIILPALSTTEEKGEKNKEQQPQETEQPDFFSNNINEQNLFKEIFFYLKKIQTNDY